VCQSYEILYQKNYQFHIFLKFSLFMEGNIKKNYWKRKKKKKKKIKKKKKKKKIYIYIYIYIYTYL